jgi:hypothetical protein
MQGKLKKTAELTDALDSRVLGVKLPPGGHDHALRWEKTDDIQRYVEVDVAARSFVV